jgi:hypothetical protein
MSLGNFKVGEGYLPAYQMSAIPFVTSSNISLGEIKEIQFPFVTRFIVIKSAGSSDTEISISFTENGLNASNSNFFRLTGGESFGSEFRTDRIFISGSISAGSFSLVAGLTQIAKSEFLVLTSSNGFSGVG